MGSNLSPEAVAARLARLRRLWVPLTEPEARACMEERHEHVGESFDQAVARRLAELRALCELTDYLHRGAETPQDPEATG